VIAEAAVAAASPFEAVQRKILAFVHTAQAAAAGGITWVEFGELLVALLRMCVETLDVTLTLSGPEKKALVLEAVASLFDAVADKAVPAVAYPVWILIRPAVRSLVLSLASGAIEQILPLVRSAK
jgi:hypothetical protein